MSNANGYKISVSSTREYINLPFSYNHWYVAGFAAEFGPEPTERRFLGRSLVFYRIEDGTLIAAQNRCPHRAYPLSSGRVSGDRLVCGYHGIEYDPDGAIAKVPCQARLPVQSLRHYPLKQAGEFVFIWMGEPGEDIKPLTGVDFLTDPAFNTVSGVKELGSNYLLMIDNLNDLTHFTFLHKDSFKIGNYYLDLPIEIGKNEEGVFCHRIDSNRDRVIARLPASLRASVGDGPVQNKDGGINVSPGVWRGYSPVIYTDARTGEPKVHSVYITHYLTPISKTRTRYWWSFSRDYPITEAESAGIAALLGMAFAEDVEAAEKMQVLLENEDEKFLDLVIAGDRASIMARREMVNWVQQEADAAKQSPAKSTAKMD